MRLLRRKHVYINERVATGRDGAGRGEERPWPLQSVPAAVSSGRVFMINDRAQRKLQHTWIVLVIVKEHLVQTFGIDGPVEYLSHILAAIKSCLQPVAGQAGSVNHRAGARRELKGMQGLSPEIQGKNLSLTVLCVSKFLESTTP